MVDILLATYNGEKYLEEQLTSIEKQTYTEWNLIVRDDCSNDKTLEILNGFKNKHPEKVTIKVNEKNLGHFDTFFKLLEESNADYIFFCDQDDVWYEDKIERGFSFVEDKTVPILYHSDQKLIDKDGKIISDSAFKIMKKNRNHQSLGEYSLRNVVTGCTILINKTLKKKIWLIDRKILRDLKYHDYAIALIAKAVGEVIFDSSPTMSYRIHETNASMKNKKISRRQKIFEYDERCLAFFRILSFYKKQSNIIYNNKVDILLIKIDKYLKKNYFFRYLIYYFEKNFKKLRDRKFNTSI